MQFNDNIYKIIPDYVESLPKKRSLESLVNKWAINVLMHSDAGADIDDEIGIADFIREVITNIKSGKFQNYDFNITVSIRTKEPGVIRLLKYGIEPYTGIVLDPTFNVINIIHINESIITIKFHDGTQFIPPNDTPDYVVCISPGLDNVITDSNLVKLRGFSHQGIPGTWTGFNDTNSKNMVSSIIDKGIPYVITTPFESFETLFGIETFEKNNIPESVHNPIAMGAFNMITSRMSHELSLGAIMHAESLVNIRYAESIGKPGTNSRLVKAIRSKYTSPLEEISEEEQHWIRAASIAYIDNIIESARIQKSTVNPIKHYDETIECVYNLTFALAEMGMPYKDDSGTRLNYSTDAGIPAEKNPVAFEKFKKIGIYTPAYDLIATKKLGVMINNDISSDSTVSSEASA